MGIPICGTYDIILMTITEDIPYLVLMGKLWNVYQPLAHRGRDKMAAIFQCIFLNENVWILILIAEKFVPRGPINNIPALFQIMACRR